MDTIMAQAIEPTSLALLAPQPLEQASPPVAAGRLPLMAFVDAETERALQESSIQLGRNGVVRGGIAKAIEYLSEQRSPHLLVVDISGVDLPLSKIHMLADVCEPGTTVVALGNQNDVGLYRDLQEAGVSQYIVKPVTRELLLKALTTKGPKTANSGDIRPALKLGKMVSVIGARGGVGATTVACNLAWYLANRQGRRVALVDLDQQHGDCSLLFNIKINPGFRDALANPLRVDHLLLDRIMTRVGERLFVLGGEEPLHDNLQFTAAAIDTLFTVLRSQFHYVIADVPRMPTPAYRRALEIADRRVIVVDQTMRSMRDAVRVAKMFDIPGTEPSAEHSNIFVANRVGEVRQHAVAMRDVQRVLQAPPASQIPFLPALVTPSVHNGLVAASRRGKFADAVATLASELSGRKPRKWYQWRVR